MTVKTEKKLRVTKQLSLIKDELGVKDFHPTAEDIYNSVRKKKPDISLGTVYRNLEKLTQLGEIVKLNVDSERHHYDGNIVPHQHFFCRKCGVIQDVLISSYEGVFEKEDSLKGFKVESVDFSIKGICPDCCN